MDIKPFKFLIYIIVFGFLITPKEDKMGYIFSIIGGLFVLSICFALAYFL